MASTNDSQDGSDQSDGSGPQSQESAASFEDYVHFVNDSDCLKKKLFDDGNGSAEDSIAYTLPSTSLIGATDLSDIAKFSFSQKMEKCPSFTADADTGGMEWDSHFATPKLDKRRGMRRTLDQSDCEDDMFMTPPPKQHRMQINEPSFTPNGGASTTSPLHQGLQHLTLFNSPHTPKSLIRRSSFQAMMQQTPLDAVKQVRWRDKAG